MDTILAFVLGVTTSYWFLAAAFALAMWAEYEDNHVGSAFLTTVALISGYLIFNLSPLLLAGYIPAGIAWSVWRWRVHCKVATLRAIEYKKDLSGNGDLSTQRRRFERQVDLKGNVDKIISWIICFPISMLERAAHDMIHVLKIFITEWFAKVYNHSTKSALDEFDKH